MTPGLVGRAGQCMARLMACDATHEGKGSLYFHFFLQHWHHRCFTICFSNAEMRQLMTCSQKSSCSIRMQQVEIFSHAMIPLVSSNHTEPLVQERFRYCGAKMLPKGSMGYVEPGQVPPTGGATEAREMLLNLGHG